MTINPLPQPVTDDKPAAPSVIDPIDGLKVEREMVATELADIAVHEVAERRLLMEAERSASDSSGMTSDDIAKLVNSTASEGDTPTESQVEIKDQSEVDNEVAATESTDEQPPANDVTEQAIENPEQVDADEVEVESPSKEPNSVVEAEADSAPETDIERRERLFDELMKMEEGLSKDDIYYLHLYTAGKQKSINGQNDTSGVSEHANNFMVMAENEMSEDAKKVHNAWADAFIELESNLKSV